MKKTVLILGANAGQLDLIKYMKSIEWNVVSCSYREGEIGERYSDSFYLVDIRDIDAVTDLTRQIKADLVFSVSSDVAMVSAIKVSERLSLPHFFDSHILNLFNNKQELREYLNNNNLSKVNFQVIDKNIDFVSCDAYPCIVKPTDSQGQRGVQKIDNADNLKEAVKLAQDIDSSGIAIIEDYLDGVELSCNVLVKNGNIVFDILSERLVYDGKYMGIPKAHLIPCINITKEDEKEALNLVHDITNSLNIENGSLYFQMKVTKNGIKIIEIAPRLDGCHMWRLIENATGENYLASTVQTLLNKCTLDKKVTLRDNQLYELVFQHTPAGQKFFKNEFPIPKDIFYHEYRYEDGDDIIPINGRLEVVGYYTKTYLLENRPDYVKDGSDD